MSREMIWFFFENEIILTTNETKIDVRMDFFIAVSSGSLTYKIPEGVCEYSYHGETIGKQILVGTFPYTRNSCASAYCQLLHTTITRSCTTVRFKQSVSPGSSNYTTTGISGPAFKPLWRGVSPQSFSSPLSLSLLYRSLSLSSSLFLRFSPIFPLNLSYPFISTLLSLKEMDNNGKHYIFHRIIITISFSSKYHISNFSKKFPSSILFLYSSLCLFFYRKFFGQNRKVYLSSNYFLRFLLLFLFFFF